MPLLVSIEKDNFKSCNALVKISLAKLEVVGENVFDGCENLLEIELPALKTCDGFSNCPKLSILKLPNLEEIG